MNDVVEDGYVSPSDIALIANVSRGAVSNWRKRSSDFPQMISGTPAKPLFARGEVMDWLERNGRIKADDESQQHRAEMELWSAMNVLRGQVAITDMGELILELAVARVEARAPDLSEGFGIGAPDVSSIESALSKVSRGDLAQAVDFVLERTARAQVKGGAESGFINSRTSAILAQLAATRSGGILYDPACGIASALIKAVDLGAKPDRVVGHDIKADVLRIARQRAVLHGVPIELVATNVLEEDVDPALRADTIILEPPYGLYYQSPARLTDPRFTFGTPPRTSSDTAWLQHSLAHLSDSGRAYVLSPSGTLFREGAEGTIRAEMVRQGCVEAVVALPGKLLPHVSIPLALWVLRRPSGEPETSRILLIDATNVATPEQEIAQWLTSPASRKRVPCVEVAIADVLAADANLSPQRFTNREEKDPVDVTAAYERGWAEIAATRTAINNELDGIQYFKQQPRSRLMTVGKLVEEGVLAIRQGKPKDRYAEAPEVLRARIISAGDVRGGTNFEGWDLDADPPKHPDLTEPGDVLVTTMHEVRARLDDYGHHLPSTGVYRLRILDPDVLSPKYLELTLAGSWNARFQGGTTIQRAPIKELEVPILPIDQQRRVGLAATAVDLLHDEASKLAQQADNVRTALLDAIRYNAPLLYPESVGDMNQNTGHASEGNK